MAQFLRQTSLYLSHLNPLKTKISNPATKILARTMSLKSNNPIFRVENLYNVKDWVVVVTGGGTGIGLMCAQAFANNGAHVCECITLLFVPNSKLILP